MGATDMKKLIRIARSDRGLQSAIASAPTYDTLVSSIVSAGKVRGLDVTRKDVDKAILDLNRLQVNDDDSTRPTADQEQLLATSLAGICSDFPPTTCWTNVAKPGNPCGPSTFTIET